MACFRYTWVFSSGDSGDWLASAKIWFVPQPYGSPLYITVAKVIGLLGGSLSKNMTFWLSCVPASIAIGLIFQSAKNIVNNIWLARLAAIIMLGAAVLTSQATVCEEYAIAVMFMCASILAYTANHKNLAVVILGLGCSIHIILFPIAFIFLFVHYKEYKYWLKRLPLFILCGVLPYALILVLMAVDTPRWIAGGLSLQSLNSYLGSTGTIGKLSIAEAPERLLHLFVFIFGGLGIAIIPAVKHAFANRTKPFVAMLALTAGLSFWLYLTDVDWTTYTFTIYAVPCVAILASMGLQNSKRLEKLLVAGVAIVLILCNIVGVNARRIDTNNPVGTNFYNETMSLPDGSYILTSKGGFYTLGILHAIADGKNVIPVFLSEPRTDEDYGYNEWLKWAQDKYGLIGNNSIEIVENADAPVFYVDTAYMDDWSLKYEFADYGTFYKEVISVK